MAVDISSLLKTLTDQLDGNSFEASDSLSNIGTEGVVNAMIYLLNHPNLESRFMAARTLGLIENNQIALPALLEAIKQKENNSIQGDLLMALEGFDIADYYVEIFRLYLFGSFKVSHVAEDLLDHKEFNITPRVIKKARKHWQHFSNNTKHDEAYTIQKREVEERLNDLKIYIDELGNSDME